MIADLYLYSQKTKKATPLTSGATITAPVDCTVELVPSQRVGSVCFYWNGTKLTAESIAPYRANGDIGVVKFSSKNTCRAIVYSKPQLKGAVLFDSTWVIKVADAPKPADPEVIRLTTIGVCNYGSDNLIKGTAVLKTIPQIAALRWWMTTSFTGSVSTSWANQALAWKKSLPQLRRITVTATPQVNSALVVKEADVRAWARSFKAACEGAIDCLQVVNEANLKKYCSGGIAQAVQVYQWIADELKGSKIEVVPPSISEDVNAFETLVKFTPGAKVRDIHPYGKDAKQHVDRVKICAAANGQAELRSSESNIHAGSFSGWRVEYPKLIDGIRPYVSEADYYRLLTNQQPAGRFGLLNADYTPNAEVFAVFQATK